MKNLFRFSMIALFGWVGIFSAHASDIVTPLNFADVNLRLVSDEVSSYLGIYASTTEEISRIATPLFRGVKGTDPRALRAQYPREKIIRGRLDTQCAAKADGRQVLGTTDLHCDVLYDRKDGWLKEKCYAICAYSKL